MLRVSLSPHIKGEFTVSKIMGDVIIALLPALGVALYVFGLNVLKVALLAVLSSMFFEYVIQKWMLKGQSTISDGSAIVTGLLLAFNLPSNLPFGMVILGSLVAIGVGKMSFGGLGNNIFNPALVGRVFLLISFPVAMTQWPMPQPGKLTSMDGITAATPLAIVKEGLKNGEAFSDLMNQLPSYSDLFFGNMGGSIGEISALALILGGLYMLKRKIISWHIPVSMVGTIFLFTGILWIINPDKFANPFFHILSGGILLGAFFMATDMVTSPMTSKGMLIFGGSIGFLTVLIRVFGSYPEGVSFAILIMNAFVPLIDKYTKPIRYGAPQHGK